MRIFSIAYPVLTAALLLSTPFASADEAPPPCVKSAPAPTSSYRPSDSMLVFVADGAEDKPLKAAKPAAKPIDKPVTQAPIARSPCDHGNTEVFVFSGGTQF